MRALIQRVSRASVTVSGARLAHIQHGLLILVCAMAGDDTVTAEKLADEFDVNLAIHNHSISNSDEISLSNNFASSLHNSPFVANNNYSPKRSCINIQYAICLNDQGMVSGLVTMEDLLEELFGEIYDEHDMGGAR